ncbi:MerR family transcriptional regulator [Streptomyces europaeiscabiei]|uniref:MerR family transcriptional regulator n=1 Tax=Streptomyces europaeiscabiei TaxID=146819 RepID=UPI0029A673B4|nr:MerR family transcriptional regulator [Streptomyces europaeiscabiei]MDX3715128.1 MerR family transcriptional regulator [Streptomyces europaeiscabiei]MDX3838780.1 MerR family transcriptional regulator [Streptomyces europaeiscabiei]
MPPPDRTSARLRPVDLARLCGVSTQQIRNYEEAGVLPPVPRTDSGYRVFGDAHRRALLTYRALSKGYGAVAATRIMRTVHEGDVPGALALVDAEHAALHAERVSLRATSEALRKLAGEPPEDDVPGTDLLIGEVAALLGVRTSTLRVWEAAGLLSPHRERATGYRQYTPEEVRDARFILALRRNHYLLDHIRPVLEDLRHEGGTDALRTAVTARRTTLTTRTAAMLEGAGHLHTYLTPSALTPPDDVAPAPTPPG